MSVKDGSVVASEPAADEVELATVLEAYLAEVERGRVPDAERLIAEHPAIAERLRACLSSLQMVELATAGLGPDAAARGSTALAPALGDYRIIREIGRGGMGVVYEAEQISLGRRVALKVLPFAAVLDQKQLRRFKTEAQAAAQLHHTNIVPVYAVGQERGVHYYAMQYIDGQPLSEMITQLRRLSGIEPEGDETPDDLAVQLASHLKSGRFEPRKPKPNGLEPVADDAQPGPRSARLSNPAELGATAEKSMLTSGRRQPPDSCGISEYQGADAYPFQGDIGQ